MLENYLDKIWLNEKIILEKLTAIEKYNLNCLKMDIINNKYIVE